MNFRVSSPADLLDKIIEINWLFLLCGYSLTMPDFIPLSLEVTTVILIKEVASLENQRWHAYFRFNLCLKSNNLSDFVMYLKSDISVVIGISFGVLFCWCNVLVFFISSPDLLVVPKYI